MTSQLETAFKILKINPITASRSDIAYVVKLLIEIEKLTNTEINILASIYLKENVFEAQFIDPDKIAARNNLIYLELLESVTEDGVMKTTLTEKGEDALQVLTYSHLVHNLRILNARHEVVNFAAAMEDKLRMNAHKRHWSNEPLDYLARRLREEFVEFEEAFAAYQRDPSEQWVEALHSEIADVANFLMMIRENTNSGRF